MLKSPDLEATDPAPALELTGPAAEPSARPAAEPPVGAEPRAIPDGTDRADGPAAIPVGSPAGSVIEAALDELTSAAAPVGGRSGGWFAVPVLAGDGIEEAPLMMQRGRRDGPAPRPESPREANSWTSRLAGLLLVAGWWGQGVRTSMARNQPAGAPRRRS